MVNNMKYLITPTLLNSWKYCIENDYGTLESFIKTLKKEEIEDQEKFVVGNEYEAYMVAHYPATKNGCYQVKVYKEINVDNNVYLLYGKIDCLKMGEIIDYKYTSNYEVGKFYGSYQTMIYMDLVPDAIKMKYVICDNFKKEEMTGNWEEDKEKLRLYFEEYKRDELKIDLKKEIQAFIEWLEKYDLLKTYQEYWQSKY